MAVHFSGFTSPLSFSAPQSATRSRSAEDTPRDIRQQTEELALQILTTFLDHQEKNAKIVHVENLLHRALNLSSEPDPRLQLIGKNIFEQDSLIAKTYQKEHLKSLQELLLEYPCGQHLNLSEFLVMTILDSWDQLMPFLPKDFPISKASFLHIFWRFYLTSHVVSILANFCPEEHEKDEFLDIYLGNPKQWCSFKPFFTHLIQLNKEVDKLPEEIKEKNVFIKRLQLLTHLSIKQRSVYFPETLIAFYPKDHEPCVLQQMTPYVDFMLQQIEAILANNVCSDTQHKNFVTINLEIKQLKSLFQELSLGACDKTPIFSKIIEHLKNLACLFHKGSLDKEEELASYNLRAKQKEDRASCVFDISCYRILLQQLGGMIEACEFSGYNYPATILNQRILSIMEVITTAEQSTYFFDTKLIQHIPEWEEIIHQITHLNLENSKKTTDFCDKVLKLSDSSQPFGCIKRPFFWVLSCNQYLQSYERDQFIIHIQKIHQQAITIFSKLPSFLKTEEMQALATQEIQNALTLKFLEFYLQRDIEHLLYNNNMMVTDYIPDEFFDLLAFEIPLTQKLTYDLALDLEKDLPSLFENSLSFSSSSAASAEEIHEEPSALEQQLFPIIAATTLPSVARSKPEPASVFKKQSPKKDTTNPGQIVKAACEDLKHVRKFRQIEQILRRLNLALSRQTGSHAIFTSSLGAQVVVPKHLGKDLKQGTLRSISAQALAAASLDP